jgi:HK97 family phage major capsid protein
MTATATNPVNNFKLTPDLQEQARNIQEARKAWNEKYDGLKALPAEKHHDVVEELNKRNTEIEEMCNSHRKSIELAQARYRNDEEMKHYLEADSSVPFDGKGGDGTSMVYRPSDRASKTLGEMIAGGDAFKNYRARAGQRTESEELPFKSFRETIAVNAEHPDFAQAAMKATLSTGLTNIDRQPGIVLLGQQVPRVADLFPQGETSGTTVRYVQETSFTNTAAAVAESGLKPEADFAVNEADAPVRKIAVIAKISDEMMADYPAVRDYINQRLPFMVEQREDAELLSGTGTSPRLRGILQTTGILSGGNLVQGADVVVDPVPHVIMRAMTRIMAESFFDPTGIVMTPFDWQNVRLMRTGDGGSMSGLYLWGSPSERGPSTIWGLPVITTVTIPVKTALVGAFQLGAQIFRRQGITVDMTNANEDDFRRNLVAIRVEERLALAVYRPQAFARVTLT